MTEESPIPNFDAAVTILESGAAEVLIMSVYRLEEIRGELGWTAEQLSDHLLDLCRQYHLKAEYNVLEQTWEISRATD